MLHIPKGLLSNRDQCAFYGFGSVESNRDDGNFQYSYVSEAYPALLANFLFKASTDDIIGMSGYTKRIPNRVRTDRLVSRVMNFLDTHTR